MIVALLCGRVEESNVLHDCIIIPVRSAISDFTQANLQLVLMYEIGLNRAMNVIGNNILLTIIYRSLIVIICNYHYSIMTFL